MSVRSPLLISNFLDSVARYPGRPALWVDEASHTYAELAAMAATIAATLEHERTHEARSARCALLVDRSVCAYAGVLGTLMAGMSYVPLNTRFPLQRNRRMIELSSASVLIVDERSLPVAKDLLPACAAPLLVLMPQTEELPPWAACASHHTYVLKRQLAAPKSMPAPPQEAEDIAYVLFTSGSTGMPKGVAVSNANVCRYVTSILERYQPQPEDRFSQFFDFTFDLSVHDMFVCWSAGACLYSVPSRMLLIPLKFVQEHQLSFWFSVPSMAASLKRYRALKPGLLPNLRWSLFCGEALPTSVAREWQAVAPNSTIENLYGPTEATIAFTAYRYRSEDAAINMLPVVPIGRPLPDQEIIVLNEEMQAVREGEMGELYLGGTQLAPGYLDNPLLTKQRFISMRFAGKRSQRWYRTGDLARVHESAGLLYCGRTDSQVKIRGYRVELQEVEAVVRRVSGTDLVAVIGWPVEADGSVQGVIAFACGLRAPAAELLRACAEHLPPYMVPQDIVSLKKMPLNVNGKIDYPALRAMAGGAQAAA